MLYQGFEESRDFTETYANSHPPMNSHPRCEITRGACDSSYPSAISQALPNHTPCDFTSGICEIATRPPVKTHPLVRWKSHAAAACHFTPSCDVARPACCEITPPVISHTSAKSHPTLGKLTLLTNLMYYRERVTQSLVLYHASSDVARRTHSARRSIDYLCVRR